MKGQIFSILVLCILAGCTTKNEGKFNLVNKANESLDILAVSICGQTSKFKDLKPGDTAQASYQVKGDCHFSITGQFKSGKKINKEDGYVTSGFNFSHEIEINDSDIDIKGGQVK